MAKILGNLVPEDDYTHELGPESNFNEIMYFNFFDPDQGSGEFLRIGNRANEGSAERTVTVYLAGGRVLFTRRRPYEGLKKPGQTPARSTPKAPSSW